jgi:succinyl-diaminopimelate desuccinylase
VESRAVEILSSLIKIPTVNPPGENYLDFVQYAEKLLRGLGMDTEIIEVPRSVVERACPECKDYPRYILLARLGEPKIHFNGHYDVVPPGPLNAWTVTRPFEPRHINGRVYGRGAVDMKGGLTSILLAAEMAVKEGLKNFEISFVPDEEIGGESGAGYLAASGKIKAPWAIIAEGSGVDNIWIGHRGLVWFLVEVYGKQAHGSTPWLGLNAFEGAAKLANKIIDEYIPRLSAKKSKYSFEDPRGASPTVTIGGEVRGSVKANVVPGYFAFTVDRRLIPEEDVEGVKNEFFEFIKSASKGLEHRVEVRVINESEPAVVPPDHPLVKLLEAAVAKVRGSEPKKTICIGGLDARLFIRHGVQTITYGPGPESTAHAPDEYVEISQVVDVARAYIELLRTLK